MSYRISTQPAVRTHRPRVFVDIGKLSGHEAPSLEGRPHDEEGNPTQAAFFSFNSDWVSWEKRAAKLAAPLVQTALKEKANTEGIYWSQWAGCPCGCTPGYVLPNAEKSTHDFVLEVVPGTRTAAKVA